jgi:hypothetical protein
LQQLRAAPTVEEQADNEASETEDDKEEEVEDVPLNIWGPWHSFEDITGDMKTLNYT